MGNKEKPGRAAENEKEPALKTSREAQTKARRFEEEIRKEVQGRKAMGNMKNKGTRGNAKARGSKLI